MSMVPFGHTQYIGDPPPRKAIKAQRRAELEVYRHQRAAGVALECYENNTHVIAEAAEADLTAEVDLLDYGLWRAGSSAAGRQLVARKVDRLVGINERRLGRLEP